MRLRNFFVVVMLLLQDGERHIQDLRQERDAWPQVAACAQQTRLLAGREKPEEPKWWRRL